MKDSREPSHVGFARFIVVKHLPEDRLSKSTQYVSSIIHHESFYNGLECGKHFRGHWLSEEIANDHDDLLEHLFIDEPVGIYEVYGEIYYAAWRCSYEYDEWESSIEIRNEKMIAIDYHQACYYNPSVFEDEAVNLLPAFHNAYEISPYMTTEKEIWEICAVAINQVVRDSNMFNSWFDTTNMTQQQLIDFIDMTIITVEDDTQMTKTTKMSEIKESTLRVVETRKHIYG